MEFNPTNGWKDRFRKQTRLVLRTVSGELYSKNPTDVELWKTIFTSPAWQVEAVQCFQCRYGYCVTYYLTGCIPWRQKKKKKIPWRKIKVQDNCCYQPVCPPDSHWKSEKPHYFKNIRLLPCKYLHMRSACMICDIAEEFRRTINANMTVH